MLVFIFKLWSLYLLPGLVWAALLNRTIDDEQGDAVTGLQPTYGGSPWNYGPECPGCFVQPEPSRCFDTSWHDVTIDPPAASSKFPYVDMEFSGIAIYVFAIVPNTVPAATTMTNLTFTLDGNLVGTYFHNPGNSTAYEYNVPVYVNEALSNSQHTLRAEAQAGTQGSYFAFDYAVYTYDDTPVTPSPNTSPYSPGTPSSNPVTLPTRSGIIPDVSSDPPPSSSIGSSSGSSTSPSSSSVSFISQSTAPGRSSTSSGRSDTSVGSSPSPTGPPSAVHPLASDTSFERFPNWEIIAVLVGSLVALAVLAIVAFCLCKRKRGKPSTNLHKPRRGSSDLGVDEANITGKSLQSRRNREWSTTQPLLLAVPSSTNLEVDSAISPPSEYPPSEVSGSTLYRNNSSTDPSTVRSAPKSVAGVVVCASEASDRTTETQRQKAALRREELERQMREIEETVANLNAQGSTVMSEPATAVDNMAVPDQSMEDTLRSRIEALQLEVERLRAEQEEVRLLAMEPPPAYEFEGADVAPPDGALEGGLVEVSRT